MLLPPVDPPPALESAFDEAPAADDAVLPPPAELEEEAGGAVPDPKDVIHEPWYAPDVLFASETWESSFEFGINGTTGNSESISFRVGADGKHKTDVNTLAVNLTYARTQAEGEETQNNAIASIRDDWDFPDAPWSLFIKQTTEYDEFKAFDVRVSANAGLGYFLVKTDASKLKTRFGGGFSHEIGGPDDSYVPEAVFGADIESKLTERQKVEGTIDYLPEWEDWDNFRIESKFSWTIQLDTERNLSLKLSVIDRYDSTPEGRRPNDLDYSLLLLWKL